MDSNNTKPFFYTITEDIAQELKEYLSSKTDGRKIEV